MGSKLVVPMGGLLIHQALAVTEYRTRALWTARVGLLNME